MVFIVGLMIDFSLRLSEEVFCNFVDTMDAIIAFSEKLSFFYRSASILVIAFSKEDCYCWFVGLLSS